MLSLCNYRTEVKKCQLVLVKSHSFYLSGASLAQPGTTIAPVYLLAAHYCSAFVCHIRFFCTSNLQRIIKFTLIFYRIAYMHL